MLIGLFFVKQSNDTAAPLNITLNLVLLFFWFSVPVVLMVDLRIHV